MIIKTNKSQLDAVSLLLGVLVTENKPTNIAEKLVYNIVKNAYNKIRSKSEMLGCPRSGYKISLTDNEALAIHVFLNNIHIPEKLYPYESIQINSMNNQIYEAHG